MRFYCITSPSGESVLLLENKIIIAYFKPVCKTKKKPSFKFCFERTIKIKPSLPSFVQLDIIEEKNEKETDLQETLNGTYLGLFPLGKSPGGKGMNMNMTRISQWKHESKRRKRKRRKRYEKSIRRVTSRIETIMALTAVIICVVFTVWQTLEERKQRETIERG